MHDDLPIPPRPRHTTEVDLAAGRVAVDIEGAIKLEFDRDPDVTLPIIVSRLLPVFVGMGIPCRDAAETEAVYRAVFAMVPIVCLRLIAENDQAQAQNETLQFRIDLANQIAKLLGLPDGEPGEA